MKSTRRWTRWVLVPLGALLALGVGLAVFNLAATAWERATDRAPGTLVRVDGRTMHVFTAGAGSAHLVLLSGYGTASPYHDFLPLVRALSPRYQVSVVEPFGYGWSDEADGPRTTARLVDEARAALAAAGVKPPYVLMPHSIAGLQVLDWIQRYPEEVRAVVAIDPSVPEQGAGEGAGGGLLGALRLSGQGRLALSLAPGLTGIPEGSPVDRAAFNRIANWVLGNGTVARQGEAFGADMAALLGSRYPAGLPVTLVLATANVTRDPRWQPMHEAQVAADPLGRVVVLEGPHYLHRVQVPALAALVDETLARVP